MAWPSVQKRAWKLTLTARGRVWGGTCMCTACQSGGEVKGARGALGDMLMGLTSWGPGRRPRPPEDERSFSEEGGAAVGGAWLTSPRPDPEGFSPCPDKDKGPFCGWRTQNLAMAQFAGGSHQLCNPHPSRGPRRSLGGRGPSLPLLPGPGSVLPGLLLTS